MLAYRIFSPSRNGNDYADFIFNANHAIFPGKI
jgi:hypothetical protein